jgi:tRNA(Ile)-lysidine synthase
VHVKLPSGAALSAFSEAIDRLTGRDCAPILFAVSGGPDSLAMLLLANAAMPDRCYAATVDHGLRPESATEAEFVAKICLALGVTHEILRPEKPLSGSLQASARRARYNLLQAHAAHEGLGWIATAHHADDQLETMLMRVARGSGVDGLSAIREQQGKIIRPLLGFGKAELEQICSEAGLAPAHDPSNENDDFDRVAMRQWLEKADHPFDALRAVRSAEALADASSALHWVTEQLAVSHLKSLGEAIIMTPADLPRELRRRLLLRAIAQLQPGLVPRGDAVDHTLAALESTKKTTLGDILCEGGAQWVFRPAPPRRQ